MKMVCLRRLAALSPARLQATIRVPSATWLTCSRVVARSFSSTEERLKHESSEVVHEYGVDRVSYFVKVPNDDHPHSLHVMNIYSPNKVIRRPPVLILHGMLSNSTMFTRGAHRLGPVLARAGFNVFVADLPGHGQSTPLTRDDLWHGFTDYINSSVPAYVRFIEQATQLGKDDKVIFCGHSFGSIIMSAAIARHEKIREKVACQVHFAAKRVVNEIYSLNYFVKVFLGWRNVCYWASKINGYWDRRFLGIDDETHRSVRTSSRWAQIGSKWVDDEDGGFDYDSATRNMVDNKLVPPTLHIAGVNDTYLAPSIDVQRWALETGQTHQFIELSKKHGYAEDYDHNSLLLSPTCEQGHFQEVIKFMERHS
jgi:pimeloyl-ACP methyl ester carboxylesterase